MKLKERIESIRLIRMIDTAAAFVADRERTREDLDLIATAIRRDCLNLDALISSLYNEPLDPAAVRRSEIEAELGHLYVLDEHRTNSLINGPDLDLRNDPIQIRIKQDIDELESARDTLLDAEIRERYET